MNKVFLMLVIKFKCFMSKKNYICKSSIANNAAITLNGLVDPNHLLEVLFKSNYAKHGKNTNNLIYILH